MTSEQAHNEQDERFLRIFQAFALIKTTGVLGYMGNEQLIKVLLYCDIKGWMRYERDKDGRIVFVACGYFLPTFDKTTCHVLPTESQGHILYIPFVVSIAKDKSLPKKAMSIFLKEHPDTEEIVFYKDDAAEPTRFKRKGDHSGKEQAARVTVDSSVPTGQPV